MPQLSWSSKGARTTWAFDVRPAVGMPWVGAVYAVSLTFSANLRCDSGPLEPNPSQAFWELRGVVPTVKGSGESKWRFSGENQTWTVWFAGYYLLRITEPVIRLGSGYSLSLRHGGWVWWTEVSSTVTLERRAPLEVPEGLSLFVPEPVTPSAPPGPVLSPSFDGQRIYPQLE